MTIAQPSGWNQGAANIVLNASGNQTGFTSTGQTGTASTDLYVAGFRELAIDFSLTALSGGVSPTINVVTKRKGADGIYYTLDTPTALSATGTLSRSLGMGGAQNGSIGSVIQVNIVITGGPTGATWTLSLIGK